VFLLLVVSFALSTPVLEAQPLEFFNMAEFTDREPPYEVKMDSAFLLKLDELRRLCDFSFHINSGYRSPKHSVEKYKAKPGTHNKGIAVDIAVANDYQMNLILRHALALGFTGIGIYPRHIHIDTRETKRVIWVGNFYTSNQARDSPNGKTKNAN